MKKTVVALIGLAMLVSPAIPSLAQESGDGDRQGGPSSECPSDHTYSGQYWALSAAPGLPGVRDVELAQHDAMLATEIRIPGEEPDCRFDSEVRIATDTGQLRFRDGADLRAGISADDGAQATIELAPNVTVEADSAGEGYLLTPERGPTLRLVGDNLSRQGDTVQIAGDAQLFAAENQRAEEQDSGAGERSGSDGADQSRRDRAQNASQADDGRERDTDGRPRVTEGSYSVGAASLNLTTDTLEDVRWRNATLFETIQVPGLTPAEERHRGPQLRLEGEDARVRVAAEGGLMARLEAEDGLQATVGEDVEVRQQNESVFLSTDNLLVVVEGEELDVRGPTIEAEELRFHARGPQADRGPVWRGEQALASAAELPYEFEGRHVAFELHEQRLTNLSVHGTPVGDVAFEPVTVEELRRSGAHFEAEGEAFELRVEDTPAVQLRLEADNLTTDLAERTTLPSGAEVHVRIEDDELRLRVDRPANALSNRTSVEHRPASEDLERTEGPEPGLQSRSERGRLGVESTSTSTIQASFDGDPEGVEGNVSVRLGLSRALLIDDANGNGKVDVGEPARAERPLTNGNVSVEGDQLVHRFPLWSGNLTVTVEPGEATAKVTYIVNNLSAPPGTLFVLENSVSAPPDANLTPTDTGVIVDNGTMSAEYSAAGPVTVDGEDAWAQRSIFVDDDDRVRLLLAYPAGDNITHDPTLAVHSSATEVVERLAASPYAIFVGAGLAGLLVAGTVLHRRRKRP